jgi:hypothetical protein
MIDSAGFQKWQFCVYSRRIQPVPANDNKTSAGRIRWQTQEEGTA